MTEKLKELSQVVRFKIKAIKDENKELMYKILRDLQIDSVNQGNDVIKCLYEHNRFKTVKMFDDNNIEDAPMKTMLGRAMKLKYKRANSSSIETINNKVSSEWTANQKNFRIGKAGIISYKNSNSPIYFRNNQVKVYKEGKKYYVSIRMLSPEYAKELEDGLVENYKKDGKTESKTYTKNQKGIWITFEIEIKKGNTIEIYEKIKEGGYTIASSQLINKKNKWFFNLTYNFEPDLKVLDETRIMGIDVGVNVPATIAISDDKYYRRFVGNGKDIYAHQQQIKERKRRVGQSRKWAGKGSIGHGRKTLMKPAEKLSTLETNYKKTKNHQFSSYIVEQALKKGCGIIQMEDLSGISGDSKFLKQWTYYDLQTKIEQKADKHGIKVIKIKPKYTSARCNDCGFIHIGDDEYKKLWRPNQQRFHCQNCGFKMNADENAARNIAMVGIEDIIKVQVAVQEKMSKC